MELGGERFRPGTTYQAEDRTGHSCIIEHFVAHSGHSSLIILCIQNALNAAMHMDYWRTRPK